VIRREQLPARDIEKDTTTHKRRESFDAVDPESGRRLDARVDVHAAVKNHVLGLVGERVDVSARMLGHDDQT
jgi:hypothetical protein